MHDYLSSSRANNFYCYLNVTANQDFKWRYIKIQSFISHLFMYTGSCSQCWVIGKETESGN